jgi:proton-dependent oligopeptide transporter, POT family
MAYDKAHHRGLYVLTFAEFWDRFSFYGLQAVLVLYATQALLFTDNQAYALYGVFTALTFATTVLGGILADRFLGMRQTIIMGASLVILGNSLLFLVGQHLLYLGLSLIICGIGLFKPNSASYVGALYKDTEAKSERAFSIFYAGMNAGALLGPLTYGYITHCCGWLYGFGISALGLLISLTIFLCIKINAVTDQQYSMRLSARTALYVGLFITIALFMLLLQHPSFFGSLLIFIGLATVIGLSITAFKSSTLDKKRILGLGVLAFFCIFFFAVSLQTATTLTLFIEREVSRTIFGFTIPTAMFLSIDPFFIILMAPLIGFLWTFLERKNCALSYATKIASGLILAAASFSVFALAALYHDKTNHLSLAYIILGDFLLGIGELCILPVALSAIAQLAPTHIRSTMMSILFLSLAFSGYLAGTIASLVSGGTNSHAIVNYTQAFLEIAAVTFLVGLIMLLVNIKLRVLLRESAPSNG